MTIQPKDPWQEAADAASGCEGPRLKHNLKEGVIYLDGAVAPPDLKVLLLMPAATHSWLKFGDNNELVDTDIRRYADVAPDRNERRPDWSPNTSCLGIIVPGNQTSTYSGASWGVRAAFEAQIVKSYSRMRGTMLPIVSLGFSPQKDDYGNHRPTFTIVGWRPRGDFATMLGEELAMPQIERPAGLRRLEEVPARIAEMVEEANAPIRGKSTIQSGRREAPPHRDDAVSYAGPGPDDEIIHDFT